MMGSLSLVIVMTVVACLLWSLRSVGAEIPGESAVTRKAKTNFEKSLQLVLLIYVLRFPVESVLLCLT